jgi:hypothetical protein
MEPGRRATGTFGLRPALFTLTCRFGNCHRCEQGRFGRTSDKSFEEGVSSTLAAGRQDDEHVDVFRKTPDQSERLGQAGTAFEQHLDTFRCCGCDDTTQHFGDPEVLLDVSSW